MVAGPGELASRPRRLWPWWLALAVVVSAPLYQQPMALSSAYDWRYFLAWIEVGRRTLMWWHQVPLWNPYVCGGMPHLANPQSLIASPTMAFALAFGTALGTKLMVTSYLFVAFDGMYRLARREGLALWGAATAAVLYGLGGWLTIRLASGHINFAGAALFPYLVLCYHRAKESWTWALAMAAVAAWIVALGGTSTPAMAAVLLVTLAAIDVVRLRSARPLVILVVAALIALCLGAVRIFPALEFAIDHPRRQWETDGNLLWEIVRNGWWWRGVEQTPNKRYWFHEYGYRMPILAAPLALWSLRVRSVRRYWIVIIVGAAIVAGSAIPYGPWWMLKHLPIFRDLRVPSRYSVMLAFALPILCGAALDDLRARLAATVSPKRVRALLCVALALLAIDAYAYAFVQYRGLFVAKFPIAEPGARFFHVRGDWSLMLPILLANHGDLKCDEEAPLQRALVLDEGDRPQAKLDDPLAGTVGAVDWSPNRVRAEVELSRPATLLVNSNWNEHWTTNVGAITKVGPKVKMDKDGGILGVALPAGRNVVEVVYRPRAFIIGAWVSALSWMIALSVVFVRRRRARGVCADV